MEKIVSRLLDKDTKPVAQTLTVEQQAVKPETKPVESEDQAEEEPEYVSAVSQLEMAHESPKPTRDTAPKEAYVHTEPSWLMQMLSNYFTGGNLLVRIGGVILFFGLAFLVKYAAEHSVISIEMRLWGIALIAVALIVTGWRLRDREGAYGQILQGLGVAILYLLIYGASKFYGLLSLEMAFVLMLGVVVLGSILAVMEDSLPLALFATAGGFLVPILTSSGDGSHIMLFSYYAFLNLGLFIVAWFRSWRVLNVVGFLFTFVIATVWGVLRYKSELFTTTEPFLILYFFMYLCISVLFTIKHPFEPKNLVDGTLVFGLPMIAFPLQISLVHDFSYAEAYSALFLGLLYLALWFWLKNKERTLLLAQSFLALSVVFFTIAIPYIFDADVSAALWSLESTGIIWIALKQSRPLTRYFGMALLFVALFVYPDSVGYYNSLTLAEYLGYLIIITATFIAAYLLDTHKHVLPALDVFIAKVYLFFAILFWFTGTLNILPRIYAFVAGQDILFTLIAGTLLLVAVTMKVQWQLLVKTLQGFLFLGMLVFFLQAGGIIRLLYVHPFVDLGAVLYGIFLLLHFLLLYLYRKEWQWAKAIHVAGLWFFVLVVSLELHYHIENLYHQQSDSLMALACVPLVVSFLLMLPKQYRGWLEEQREAYQMLGAGGLLTALGVWQLRTFSVVPVGNALPVFNLLDIIQIMVLAMMGYWGYRQKNLLSKEAGNTLYGAVAIMGILLITVIFARAVHHSQGIAYNMHALWDSDYFQTGLSLLWSMIAIVLMVLSKRYGQKILWLGGFGLLIVVVLKLFFVELAHSGTIERIVSFIVVGTLLLLIGYFVPMPPGETEHDET
ncbi:DUF2339 domain-containing protein [Sulfurovum sp. NBC37-1]|uniref:DUF2339 domain-containing protein n=1 Tax=Sulfurovum sp. (strain NBC37-1) TaxID=387093 RepID=UPI00130509FB|nr:DUF2339 domain-containing protein [Sulfurovum sp. NBC37-1]